MRWIVLMAVLSLGGCRCCPEKKCGFGFDVSVSDETGAEVTDFTATVSSADGSSTKTCPGEACTGNTAHFGVNDGKVLTVSVSAGSRSAMFTITPEFTRPVDELGCRGCPLSGVDVTVR